MNNLEIVQSSMQGYAIDRIPCFPILIAPACELTGTKQGDYSQDPEIMAGTLIEATEICGFDGIYVSRDNLVMHEALGGTMVFPEDDEPYSKEVLIGKISDFKKLSLPDPNDTPGMKTVLASARKVVEQVGDRYYIQANIDSGPFSLAGILRGVQDFLMDVCIEPAKLLHDYLEFCTEVVIAYGKAMQATGVHGIQFGDSIAGLVGPDCYKDFALPYQRKAVDALHNPDCDLWIHICGKAEHIIAFLSDLDIQGFEVDAMVDMSEAFRMLGGGIAVKGNLDTMFLLSETPDKIYKSTQDMLRKSGLKTKIIASPGCGVPRMTPLQNLKAMVQACKDYKSEE